MWWNEGGIGKEIGRQKSTREAVECVAASSSESAKDDRRMSHIYLSAQPISKDNKCLAGTSLACLTNAFTDIAPARHCEKNQACSESK